MVGGLGLLGLLEGVVEAVLEEGPDLVLGLVEDLLKALEERLDFFPGSVQPLLKHTDGLLLLFVALLQSAETPFI